MRIEVRWVVRVVMAVAVGASGTACTDGPVESIVAPSPEPASVAPRYEAQVAAADRTLLQDGIAHYTYDLELGPGPYDVVRLHRIVKERPHDPTRTQNAVFLLPGAPNSWVQIFVEPLISDVPPWDHSVAIFLAQNGVDVWGIDYAWAQVPMGATDFGFMQGWGVQKDVDFAYEALATARSIRVSTGQGNGRLHLLGFSYGGPVGYGVLGLDTQLPPGQRLVKGFVAVDTELKVQDPDRRAAACADADAMEAEIAGGVYENGFVGLIALAGLAESAPSAPSAVAPGLTNWQFILFATASGLPHFVGGEFNESGVPTGLRFTEPALWIDVIQATRPYWPLQATADVARSRCESGRDVAFDNHLGEISVPILYVGAAGGTALKGAYTAGLTATRDYEELLVQRLPESQRTFDFGHADLFTATEADAFVWEPILQWIDEHREERTYPSRPER